MAKFLTKILATTVAALVAAYFLRGIHIENVTTAVILALVLAFLNTFVKPILVILTIPITIITLGLFLLVINVVIIKWTADLVPGFDVDGWWWALLFSLIVSFVSSIIESLADTNRG